MLKLFYSACDFYNHTYHCSDQTSSQYYDPPAIMVTKAVSIATSSDDNLVDDTYLPAGLWKS